MDPSESHSSAVFMIFYILSFSFSLAAVLIFSIRKGYQIRSVLLMLTSISLMTIIGSRLFTIPLPEWGRLFGAVSETPYHNRSAIGGLIFGLGTLLFTQKFFGFGKPMLNLYAWITPIGLGIQKLGCLFNGCCYGRLTDLPWGIHYGLGAPAHFDQLTTGMINNPESLSMAVHPVQLYEALLLFTIGFIAIKTCHLWKKSGSALIMSLVLFCLMRFGMEFLRDPASSAFNSGYIFGIRSFVWALLLAGLFLSALLYLYEARLPSDPLKVNSVHQNIKGHIALILLISLLIFSFRNLLTGFETAALEMRFIPAVILTAVYLYKHAASYKYRLANSFLLILPFVLMSQSFPEDSVKISKYKRVDVGITSGTVYSTMRYNPHEGECGTTYTRDDYQHKYGLAGAGYSQIIQDGNLTKTMGMNLYLGSNKETNNTKNYTNSSLLVGVNPYIKGDWKWIGIGGGAHLGNIRWVPMEPIDERLYDRGTRFSPLLPEFYIRIGRRDIIDFRYSYGFNFPSPFPAMTMETSLGSGFGQKQDYSLRFGAMFPTGELYFSGEGLIKKTYGFKVIALVGGYYESYLQENDMKTPVRLAFSLNYRFGFLEQ